MSEPGDAQGGPGRGQGGPGGGGGGGNGAPPSLTMRWYQLQLPVVWFAGLLGSCV